MSVEDAYDQEVLIAMSFFTVLQAYTRQQGGNWSEMVIRYAISDINLPQILYNKRANTIREGQRKQVDSYTSYFFEYLFDNPSVKKLFLSKNLKRK